MSSTQIFAYWPQQVARSFSRWCYRRIEHHYLMCADVEQQRAREAQMNVAYYQKRAAMARSAGMTK